MVGSEPITSRNGSWDEIIRAFPESPVGLEHEFDFAPAPSQCLVEKLWTVSCSRNRACGRWGPSQEASCGWPHFYLHLERELAEPLPLLR